MDAHDYCGEKREHLYEFGCVPSDLGPNVGLVPHPSRFFVTRACHHEAEEVRVQCVRNRKKHQPGARSPHKCVLSPHPCFQSPRAQINGGSSGLV